ncbi:hypothetical protein LCGC14_0342950 [marine sediment metagenome]|uniref:Probable DNA 3'-5' helicase RecG n=1 Tax=marine sediment metagenome TaxID=412755 RepID=A0A0F9TVX3_9ZZZZ
MKLYDSVRFLKGVGPKRIEALRELGLDTIQDLLRYYPREWVFARQTTPIGAGVGDTVILTGKLSNPITRGGAVRASITANDDSVMSLIWFNSPYLMKALRGHPTVTVWGKVTEYTGLDQMVSPRWKKGEAGDLGQTAMAVYPASAKASSEFIAKLMRQVLAKRGELGLSPELMCAYGWIHTPKDKRMLSDGKQALKRDELVRLFEGNKKDRALIHGGYQTIGMGYGANSESTRCLRHFRDSLPFTLTTGQLTAFAEVFHDLDLNTPMYRLLQGDVGCGKTVVAVGASVAVANAGYQTIVLCPTQVLARQHYRKWREYIGDCGYGVGLVTSGYSSGHCHKRDVIVATTSALSDRITFDRLGLLIIDEEQKFGRDQKELLVKRYPGIHRLYMTATPIPQVLCMTAFGDLDVTTIKTMPSKRKMRFTHLVYPQRVDEMFTENECRMSEGDRMYVVFPRIEGPGGLNEACQGLSLKHRHSNGIAVLAGSQTTELNEHEMDMFKTGECNILFCTSMVEVGVDVPEANIMVIHEAHMFGLSQLHQLRGRIGRGDRPSVCYLMANTDEPAALEKLQYLVEHDDGFEIAQQDLAMRGPGELVGERQSGLSELKLVDLVSDFDLIKEVRKEVMNVSQG